MAKAFKCDVCKKYFDYNHKECHEIVLRHGKPSDIKIMMAPEFVFDEEHFECCPECMKKLCDAINFARGYTDGVL